MTGFLWESGEFHLIHVASEDTPSMALAINDSGTVLGTYIDQFNGGHGFLDIKGQITYFDPPGSMNTVPGALNASGMVAGTYEDNTGVTRGFIRDASGIYRFFSFPDPHSGSSTVTGLNDAGQVTGFAVPTPQSVEQGFIRGTDSTLTFFSVPGYATTLPAAINNRGQITGFAGAVGVGVGFARDPSGKITLLEATSAGSTGATNPTSINDSGEIVGFVIPAIGTIRSFTWSGTGKPAEFQIGAASGALKVNSSGDIVGWASKGGYQRGFLLSLQ